MCPLQERDCKRFTGHLGLTFLHRFGQKAVVVPIQSHIDPWSFTVGTLSFPGEFQGPAYFSQGIESLNKKPCVRLPVSIETTQDLCP